MAEIKNFPNNVDEYIGAQNVMKWLHGRTSGVFGADGNLSVTANGDMTVSVSDGVGWLANDKADGTVFWNDTKEQTGNALQLEIPLADPILPRIDRIVVSWDTVDYAAKPRIEVLKGTAASTPAAPALTNNGLLRQISLVQIAIPAAASKITAGNITDERLDSTVCGLVTNWVSIDTNVMQKQFDTFLQKITDDLNDLEMDKIPTMWVVASSTFMVDSWEEADGEYVQTRTMPKTSPKGAFEPKNILPPMTSQTDVAATDATKRRNLGYIARGKTEITVASTSITMKVTTDTKPDCDLDVYWYLER